MATDHLNFASAVIGLLAAALILGSVLGQFVYPAKVAVEPISKRKRSVLLGLFVTFLALLVAALIALFVTEGFLSVGIAGLAVLALSLHFRFSPTQPSRREILDLVLAVGILASLIAIVGVKQLSAIQERSLNLQEEMLDHVRQLEPL